MKLSKVKQEELIDEMIDFLIKENGIKPDFDYLKLNKRNLLNNLLLLHATENLGDYFYSLQDKLLASENDKTFNVLALNYKKDIAYAKADVTNINADMVVYFAKDIISLEMTETSDNKIMLKAGVQVGADLYQQYKENGFLPDYNSPYITEAYNLPANYLAKILVSEEVDYQVVFKQIYDFALENEVYSIFIDLPKGVERDAIIEFKPKQIKLIFKEDR